MVLRTAGRIVGFCALLLHCACSDDGLTKLRGEIETDPEAIDFGDGIIDQNNVVELLIKNVASGFLEVERIDVEGDVFSIGEAPGRIQPLSMTELDVTFVPRTPHEVYEGALVIHSDDPDDPELRVPLRGVGGVREIEVTPLMVDFGTVNEGTAPRRTIQIANIGGDPLIVSEVTWTSTSIDLGPVPGTFTGGELLPGTSTVVELVYSPEDRFGDTGVITIASNDEDEPTVEVPVTGLANLAPRAIAWGCDKVPGQIGCDGREKRRTITAGFRRIVGLDGRDSFNPEGGAITTYRWRVVSRPDGSNAVPFISTEDRDLRNGATGDIEVDRVGRFDLRLIVVDERGVESLDKPESHVLITPKDLEVLLRWDINTDVDLHFVQPGGLPGDYGSGAAGTSTGSDCSTFNRAPNWNDDTTALDDPRLDKDDVSGRGPEIVSIDTPAAVGPHAVFVHYCDSQFVNVNVHVTIEVLVRGEVIATIPANGNGFSMLPGELWEGAHVTWDPMLETATVEPFEMSSPTLRPDLCLIQ